MPVSIEKKIRGNPFRPEPTMSGIDPAGMAALSIAEALILLLVEKGVLKSVDIIEALESCVESHRIGSAEASSESEQARQTEAARLIEHLMLGRNLDATARRS